MEKKAYTFTNIETPYYELPEDCNELISVGSLRYNEEYKYLDFIRILKGEKIIGFSLYKLFDSKVEKGIEITYKTL